MMRECFYPTALPSVLYVQRVAVAESGYLFFFGGAQSIAGMPVAAVPACPVYP